MLFYTRNTATFHTVSATHSAQEYLKYAVVQINSVRVLTPQGKIVKDVKTFFKMLQNRINLCQKRPLLRCGNNAIFSKPQNMQG